MFCYFYKQIIKRKLSLYYTKMTLWHFTAYLSFRRIGTWKAELVSIGLDAFLGLFSVRVIIVVLSIED